MRYLVLGGEGQLASAFIKRFLVQKIPYVALGKQDLDITNEAEVLQACQAYQPAVILNCAAYNLVDRAESDATNCYKVNTLAPQLLAQIASRKKIKLVHFSSDYVFDGLKESALYREEDLVAPLNIYGVSKRDGEIFVCNICEQSLVFRLSWVFGEGTQNFIFKLLGWAEQNSFLKIACDEFSVPTHTDTIVMLTMAALDQGLSGLYHLTNSGYCSRYEWAAFVLQTLGIEKFIRPVTMASFKLPARRPGFSAMSNQTLQSELAIPIVRWQDAVSSFLRESCHG